MHTIAGKAVCFREAMQPEFGDYQHQIVRNAQALAQTLQELGLRIVSGGTDTHLLLVDLTPVDITGQDAQNLLDRANITANKNAIPFETRSKAVTSGIRFGTPALTTRGMKEEQMRLIGACIYRVLAQGETAVEPVRQIVLQLCEQFPLYA